MGSENRRSEFRVNILLYTRWKPLTAGEQEAARQGKALDLLVHKDLPNPIEDILLQVAPGSEDEKLYKSIQLLNNKLDFLIDHILTDRTQSPLTIDKVIELSGSGLKFVSRSAPSPGALLHMYILMPETFQYQIDLIAEVVRTEEHGGQHAVSVQITAIDEASKDAIVQVVFKKHRQEIRRKKRKEGGSNCG